MYKVKYYWTHFQPYLEHNQGPDSECHCWYIPRSLLSVLVVFFSRVFRVFLICIPSQQTWLFLSFRPAYHLPLMCGW